MGGGGGAGEVGGGGGGGGRGWGGGGGFQLHAAWYISKNCSLGKQKQFM